MRPLREGNLHFYKTPSDEKIPFDPQKSHERVNHYNALFQSAERSLQIFTRDPIIGRFYSTFYASVFEKTARRNVNIDIRLVPK